jgi:aspartate/tyrosine/aromatic aminotransferase
MRLRVARVRHSIASVEQLEFGSGDLAFFAKQAGMFSLLPLTEKQETALTQEHGIHVVKGGRVNVARLGSNDVKTLIKAVKAVKRD